MFGCWCLSVIFNTAFCRALYIENWTDKKHVNESILITIGLDDWLT